MSKINKIATAEFKKSARVVSDYVNDMIFEQPRDGLMKQTFISMEKMPTGLVKVTTTERKFGIKGDYYDTSKIEVL